MLLLKDPSELKCQLADLVNQELLEKWYGIENCGFLGYSTMYDIIFQIDLLEAGKDCNKKTTC